MAFEVALHQKKTHIKKTVFMQNIDIRQFGFRLHLLPFLKKYVFIYNLLLVCRILEASILEASKAGTKRKRGEIWFVDPLNPNERKRAGSEPVGLKNIGNTCWFAAVIQV